MPAAAYRYPGVYIQEIPSGVHAITGVSTSTAAFVGWAPKGAVDKAVLVESFDDFQREFGGLTLGVDLGYAVLHFFQNSGTSAYIVRLVNDDPAHPAESATTASATIGGLIVSASSPGDWANDYQLAMTGSSDPNSPYFRLQVLAPVEKGSKQLAPLETFERLSMDPGDSRYVVQILKNQSELIRAKLATGDAAKDAATTKTFTAKIAADAKAAIAKASADAAAAGATPAAATAAGAAAGTAVAAAAQVAFTPGAPGKVLQPADAAFLSQINIAVEGNGFDRLQKIDLFNLLCVPGLLDVATITALEGLCVKKRAFMIVDCDKSTGSPSAAINAVQQFAGSIAVGKAAQYGAIYFPRIIAPDPLRLNQPWTFPPCGAIAGLYAQTDNDRGVWKAPAGTAVGILGIQSLDVPLTDDQNGDLNVLGINCLRTFPVYGSVVWGARTLDGADERASEYKYIPIRRTTLFIEESLYRGTKWVVFEPNDEPLWAQIRLNVGAFMNTLFRQGAFQGATPREAYLVKCDHSTTTQNDINRGVVNIVVGFAPLKPAEFVVIQIQQLAGQIAT